MTNEKEIFFQCRLTGQAAEMVLKKIDDKKKEGVEKYGKQRATEALLCELWQLRNKK